MSSTAEAAAAAAARAPAAPAAPAVAAARAGTRCDNCGAAVEARYCGACGQKLEAPVHSLWHFTQLATEDLTHADSRLWRTLAALLFRPGFLTREFLHGRRARYLPPLRLYLVLSVVFFVVAGTGQRHFTVLEFDDSKPLSGSTVTVQPLPKTGETPRQRADRVCASATTTARGRAHCSRCSTRPAARAPWTTATGCRPNSCTTSRAPCSCSCRCSPAA
ncbi:MAG TPA: DUF3667 domain-containing protein [Candidatus Dormibacteraeota bacterium]|nr:DUF3667 domain-containing protein [Candidatus Dormibacteraeota bacterium]